MSEGLVSVIPTYRPTEDVLALAQVLAESGPVVLSDDASPCTFDGLLAQAALIDGVTVVRHESNEGIARGLNDGLDVARSRGCPWLLTMDQDSTIPAEYVSQILSFADSLAGSLPHVGVVAAESVLDSSGPMTYPVGKDGGLFVTEEVIQSGSLWRVPALSECGGFDQSLGTDAVDAAACLALREHGYLVAIAPGLEFGHTIGAARQHRLLGRTVMVTHHSPARQSTMVRNRVRLFPRELRQSPKHAIRTIRRVLVNNIMTRIHAK